MIWSDLKLFNVLCKTLAGGGEKKKERKKDRRRIQIAL